MILDLPTAILIIGFSPLWLVPTVCLYFVLRRLVGRPQTCSRRVVLIVGAGLLAIPVAAVLFSIRPRIYHYYVYVLAMFVEECGLTTGIATWLNHASDLTDLPMLTVSFSDRCVVDIAQ